MTIIATGVNKRVSFKRQTAQGTFTPTTGSQYLRRVTSSLDKKKATYSSNEIRPSQQISDFRHGVVSVDGAINGELSVGGYQSFFESLCRQLAQTAITASQSDFVSAATTGAMGTITTIAGQFVTSGFRPGMVMRCTGWTSTGVSLNSTNLLIVSINTAGKVMTVLRLDGSAVPARTETAAVTMTEVGKHTFVPQTGQTRDYYMIEHFFSDIAQSELFQDCVISQADVSLPASGLATCNFNVMGLNMSGSTSQQLGSPTAAATGAILASANGALIVNGLPVGLITGMNFSLKGGYTKIGGVVGQNVEPDIFPGTFTSDGQCTVLFQDNVMRDYFLGETEVGIIGVFTAGSGATADFVSFTFPRCKFGGAAKDDGNKGLVMTMPFTALENKASDNTGFQTTFMVQDSLFV